MEREIVKSSVGCLTRQLGESIAIIAFVCEGLHTRAVLLGERALDDLVVNLGNLYSSCGEFKVVPRPANAQRQLEFETLGAGIDDFPFVGELFCNTFRIHPNAETVAIQIIEFGKEPILFVFDHHALGEFLSQIEQMSSFVAEPRQVDL